MYSGDPLTTTRILQVLYLKRPNQSYPTGFLVTCTFTTCCFSFPLQALLLLYGYGTQRLDLTAATYCDQWCPPDWFGSSDPSCDESYTRFTHRSIWVFKIYEIIQIRGNWRGIKEIKWAGRLLFHTRHLPSSPEPQTKHHYFHSSYLYENPASVKTLGDCITYLLTNNPIY